MSSYCAVSEPAGKVLRWIASRTDKRCEECSEWEEEWNEREERVCVGAEREVASSRARRRQQAARAWAAGSGGDREEEAEEKEEKKEKEGDGHHPEGWRLYGHHQTRNLKPLDERLMWNPPKVRRKW